MRLRNVRLFAAMGASFVLVLGLAALTSGCGDDGDASGKTPSGANAGSSSTAKSEATKAADAGSANATGTDKEYVRDVCDALNLYIESFSKKFSADPTLLNDQGKLLKAIAPELEAFGKNLEKAKPPRDAAKFHEQMVKGVAAVAERLKKGQVKSLQELGEFATSQVDEPTKAVQQRLAAAAKEVPECRNTGGLFGQ